MTSDTALLRPDMFSTWQWRPRLPKPSYMPLPGHISMVVVGQVVSYVTSYLSGGLCAATHKGGCLMLRPTVSGGALLFNRVTDLKGYYAAIRSHGFDLIGTERVSDPDGLLAMGDWYPFDPGRQRTALAVDQLWSQIGNTCRQAGDTSAADLARSITFSLRASALRLRDCAKEYHWQNSNAVVQKQRPGGRFSNIKSFDLDIALHSLLVEMGSARDYLAHFISRQMLKERSPVDAMVALHERAKRGKLPSASPHSVLIDEVLKICDEEHSEGWMARLGEFRNIIVHRSPISSLAERHFLIADTVSVGDHALYQIRFPIPSDPFNTSASEQVDALNHFLDLHRRLRAFAQLVAEASGIKPTMLNITDNDLVGVGTSNVC